MPKSLGQIHTTKFNYEALSGAIGENNAFLCDNSAKLSAQFNRNIRMMQSYKWVGADIVVQLPDNLDPTQDSTQVIVKGRMRYFAPTKGRCQALRDAYRQFRETAKGQGVNPAMNRLFDFRVLPRGLSNYPLNSLFASENIYNTTTLDGTNELSMTDGASGAMVFNQYNVGVVPTESTVTGSDFNSGLKTQLGTLVTQTDFVVNEGLIQSGNPNIADTEFEEIPFTLSYDSPDKRTMSLQWRPDPALYVSVLGGFVEIVLDEITATGADTVLLNGVEMDISLHWAGWKSIVQAPRSRKRFPNRQQKKIAKQVGGVLTSKEAKSLARMLKKLM